MAQRERWQRAFVASIKCLAARCGFQPMLPPEGCDAEADDIWMGACGLSATVALGGAFMAGHVTVRVAAVGSHEDPQGYVIVTADGDPIPRDAAAGPEPEVYPEPCEAVTVAVGVAAVMGGWWPEYDAALRAEGVGPLAETN